MRYDLGLLSVVVVAGHVSLVGPARRPTLLALSVFYSLLFVTSNRAQARSFSLCRLCSTRLTSGLGHYPPLGNWSGARRSQGIPVQSSRYCEIIG
jgi:hypothetical protein